MRNNHNKQRNIAIMMSAIATMGIYARQLRHRPEDMARKEMATARRVARLAGPVCRRLCGEGQELTQITEAMTHRVWTADCVDSRGDVVVHTIWDAQTGALFEACHYARRYSNGKQAPVSADQAATVAWRWLDALGGGNMAPRWTLLQPPVMAGVTWKVVLSSEKYSATVFFDKYTQDLALLVIKETTSPLTLR
jgi:hypothetical protein